MYAASYDLIDQHVFDALAVAPDVLSTVNHQEVHERIQIRCVFAPRARISVERND